jgi:hypothetical protein
MLPRLGRKEDAMPVSKLRVSLLTLLAMSAAGAYVASVASAEGPFLHRRAVGNPGSGTKISESEPEVVASAPGKAFFKVVIAGSHITITTEDTQVKGIVYDNALQGQAKIKTVYVEPRISEPSSLKACTVNIGNSNDTTVLKGHLVWSWNGENKQLEEVSQKAQKPYWLFTPAELLAGSKGLPKGILFPMSFTGAECVLAGIKIAMEGSYANSIEPGLEEWSLSETQSQLPNEQMLHFWNGTQNIGAKTETRLGGQPFTFVGELTFKTLGTQGGAAQEIARFEK